jgi:hydroxymethylbilane synthase
MRRLRLATRGSAQATTQAEHVAAALRRAGVEVELTFVETTGDARPDVPIHTIGGQGAFVKEVQVAVLDGRADLAVHSAKDLRSTPEAGLLLAAFCQRRTAADALVGSRLVDLAHGATVATGSVRRRRQIARARPDLQFTELRGNIPTRLTRIPTDGAIVIAVAALEVLQLTDRITEVLDPAEFVPAVGQGCVAVECRADDGEVAAALAGIDHATTRREVEIERAYLAQLGSGCSMPVGAYVDGIKLHTFLAGVDTGIIVSETIELTGDTERDCDVARRAALDAHDVVSGRLTR